MSLFLLLALETPLKTERLNEAAKSLDIPLVYESNIDLGSHSGFLPVTLNDKKTGVETYKISYSDIAGYLPPNENIDPSKTLVIQFRWGGDFYEGAIALYTAMIYSAKYNGIAFDPMSNMYLGGEQLSQGVEAFLSYAEE